MSDNKPSQSRVFVLLCLSLLAGLLVSTSIGTRESAPIPPSFVTAEQSPKLAQE